MSDELFSLRPAVGKDRELIDAYAYAEGMDRLPSLGDVTVAANANDECVGFLRLAFSDAGVAHVNPVVVYGTWRGYGVGRALMEDALDRCGELRLVARGSSVGFYRTLGFSDIAWDDIAPGVTEDCEHCDFRDECGPVPMAAVAARL